MIEKIKSKYKELSEYSRFVLWLGIALSIIMYIYSFVCFILFTSSPDFWMLKSVYIGGFEVAPAMLAVSALCIIICEIYIRDKGKK